MRKNIASLFDKLSKAENAVFNGTQEILSPVVTSQPIKVRIDGIIMTLRVNPKNFEGWGVFKAKSHKEADFVREASMSERQAYLDLYPRFTAVVYQQGKRPQAVIVNSRYKNTILDGIIKILLPENINQFDSVAVRWDGQSFWYDEHSTNANLINAERLRLLIADKAKVELVNFTGITPAEKSAYELAFENVKDKVKDRLENALARSGGKLVSYTDRGNNYTVTYTVGNRNITSTVDETLRVQSAGICLSGGDRNFDLQSLVNVIREGERRRSIVVGDYANYGGGDDYDDY